MSITPLPILITAVGAYFLYRLRAFYILHPIASFKSAIASLKNKDNLTSFTIALAGTLGVGNVFGVAVGIIVGGAGSVLWLLVSALFSSVLKYAEVTLAEDNKSGTSGGMFYCIRNTYRRLGTLLSRSYAAICLVLALVMGAALQTRTLTDTASEIFDTPPYIVAIIFLIVVAISVIGGRKIIGEITLYCIPLTTIIYIILTTAVIIINIEHLPSVLSTIFAEAFEISSATGGVLGFLTSRAIAEGYSRGILSNEAGAGTSTIAHSTGTNHTPKIAGLFGTLEVFFDTVLLCMLTAFAILLSVPSPESFTSGMSLVLSAIGGTLGTFPGYLLLLCVLVFAYSTVVSWYYYGTECYTQLFGTRGRLIFLPLFLVAILLGAFIPEGTLVLFADIALLALTLLTLPTLIKNSDRICVLSVSDDMHN